MISLVYWLPKLREVEPRDRKNITESSENQHRRKRTHLQSCELTRPKLIFMLTCDLIITSIQ